jgi:hypothetical protein
MIRSVATLLGRNVRKQAWLFALLLFDNNIKEGRHDSWEGLEWWRFWKRKWKKELN